MQESVRETTGDTEPAGAVEEPEPAHHPGPREYIKVAVVLAVATAAEVGLYYIPGIPSGLLITLLLFFAVIKFALVVLWFMHLRFDSLIFRRLFVTGLALAVVVYVVALSTLRVFFR
jgi:cytochrome c oxidase subunit 4